MVVVHFTFSMVTPNQLDTRVLLKCFKLTPANPPGTGPGQLQVAVSCLTGKSVGTQNPPTYTFTSCVRHGQLEFFPRYPLML